MKRRRGIQAVMSWANQTGGMLRCLALSAGIQKLLPSTTRGMEPTSEDMPRKPRLAESASSLPGDPCCRTATMSAHVLTLMAKIDVEHLLNGPWNLLKEKSCVRDSRRTAVTATSCFDPGHVRINRRTYIIKVRTAGATHCNAPSHF